MQPFKLTTWVSIQCLLIDPRWNLIQTCHTPLWPDLTWIPRTLTLRFLRHLLHGKGWHVVSTSLPNQAVTAMGLTNHLQLRNENPVKEKMSWVLIVLDGFKRRDPIKIHETWWHFIRTSTGLQDISKLVELRRTMKHSWKLVQKGLKHLLMCLSFFHGWNTMWRKEIPVPNWSLGNNL